MHKYHPLTSEEEKIIVYKGTEPPGSGKYEHFKDEGIYLCLRCDAPLFLSSHKFDSSCGWPSFDDEIEDAIERRQDPDGRRTEIICHHCQAHLGHVFENEHITRKNLRHCVNSLSMRFVAAYTKEGYEHAFFAGGCFWGCQDLFKKIPGVISTRVGYMGGEVISPTYEEVCTGKTGHVESIEVIFDPTQITFEKIAKYFFNIHDPTQTNGQGPDIGEQYLSVLFYLTEEQKAIGEQLIHRLTMRGFKVVTSLRPASMFYAAEEYHQDYYEKTGKHPYCHLFVERFT